MGKIFTSAMIFPSLSCFMYLLMMYCSSKCLSHTYWVVFKEQTSGMAFSHFFLKSTLFGTLKIDNLCLTLFDFPVLQLGTAHADGIIFGITVVSLEVSEDVPPNVY